MKFSLKWLGDFVPVEEFFKEPEKLSGALTQAGLEVDFFEDQKPRFKNVVVAQIQAVKKHPQADRLTVCQVFDGQNVFSIVCGAKNHKALDKAVLAKPGAILPGDIKIKKTRLRGIESEGMLASRAELGFDNAKEEGIWILPPEAKTGESFSSFLSWDDIIFEIAVPPNRSDCLSHKGLAREISCLFDLPFSKATDQTFLSDQNLAKKSTLSLKKSKGWALILPSLFRLISKLSFKKNKARGLEVKDSQEANRARGLEVKDSQNKVRGFEVKDSQNKARGLEVKDSQNKVRGFEEKNFQKINKSWDLNLSVKKSILVQVQDFKACPRYSGRLIEGVEIKESPVWLKQRLQSLGLKSINNVVDITNFVLWDSGQPLHAFDRDKIQNIFVASSQKGEKFLALDESEITLTGEELVIRDEKSVLALAGVIGGKSSSITKETKNIFIESAGFAPEKIRKTARRFGLETDSSYRFVRGVDFLAVKEAMDRACFLIQKEAGGRISHDFYDIQSQSLPNPEKIKISLEDLESRLGYKITSNKFQNWIKRLGCKIKAQKEDFFIWPPSFRPDLSIKEDLIEELARLEGYDKIPERLSILKNRPKDFDPRFLSSQKLIRFLSGKGWSQAINYSFCDPAYYEQILSGKFYLEELAEGKKKEESPSEKIKELKKEESSSEKIKETFQPSPKTIENFSLAKPELKKEEAGHPKSCFFVNNPISQQLSLMKPLLAPDLIKNVSRNVRHNNKQGQIFELSPIFYKRGESYYQNLHLGLAIWGSPLDIWQNKKIPNVYVVKSILESLFDFFRLKGGEWRQESFSFLHPAQSLLFQGRLAGFAGRLHPLLIKKHKLPEDLALAEIHWELLDQAKKSALKFKPFSKLSSVEKDLSFIIPLSVPAGEVQKEIKKSLGSLCESLTVFDVYEKAGERSVSFRMRLVPKDKSWTDDQLQAFLNQAIQTARKKFSISLR